MHLYLVRHGEAEAIGGAAKHDGERALSLVGIQQVNAMALLLSEVDPSISLILTSSLKRAVQTGEAIRQHLPSSPELRMTAHLNPGFTPADLIAELSISGSESVVAIGHQPDMSGFISYLITKSHASVEMGTSSVACIELALHSARPDARLRWLYSPELQQAQERVFQRSLS
jgi:phosphohistidine phosphatase SixA